MPGCSPAVEGEGRCTEHLTDEDAPFRSQGEVDRTASTISFPRGVVGFGLMGVIAKSDVDPSTGPMETVLPCDMELSPWGLSTSIEADVEEIPELGASFPILS
jgi:hypothetical protein